ncbi:MFS transporter [Marinomonas fungiae]|uniref:Predicted arabinose efflux permease, MFS family n=1 Tax=Marinomonas fungiae TaxID=1137284 RepID=A0A0K6IHS7_9GAMM|nr:MFS transporter [Marinomonas fungiae]CUB02616.1 Predicted arabinose efflux permease, MFS family [Marinomonas fungiae]
MNANHFLADWRQLSAASRVLVINGFTFNLGFYMLLPYLADHLQRNLGLSPWHVGLVIGLRVLSQQGMFLVGGTLGDYLGYKRLILLGCLVRVAGFALLGVAANLPLLLLGAFLTGFAGALFTPSSNAYLAYEAPDQLRRDRIFAMQNWTSEAGMFLGPLLGIALLSLEFLWVGVGAAALFMVLFFVQWCFLPELLEQERRGGAQGRFWHQWHSMLRNRAFIKFICCACAFQLFFHQLYLSLPDEVSFRQLSSDVITWVFMTSSIMGILLQMPISRWVSKTIGNAKAMGAGITLMGCSYLLFMFQFEVFSGLNFIVYAVLFSFGSMLVLPLLGSYVPTFCHKSELGSYYGLYSCMGGVTAFLGNIGVGALLSWQAMPREWIWLGFALVGCIAGYGLYRQVTALNHAS